MPSNYDLWRTQLCRHGPRHVVHDDCQFAHSLSDLLFPNESHSPADRNWENYGVDRWLGQALSKGQVSMIGKYYEDEQRRKPWSIPQWAHGLQLIVSGTEKTRGLSLQWDFGLQSDVAMVLRGRGGRRAWEWMEGLWDRLECRKEMMLLSMRPVRRLADLKPFTLVPYELPPHTPEGDD